MNKLFSAQKRWRAFGWVALFLLPVLAFAWVAVPVWKIQPFAPQTSEALQLSYALRRWSPAATVAALIAAPALKRVGFYGPRRERASGRTRIEKSAGTDRLLVRLEAL